MTGISPWSLVFLLGACQGAILSAVLIFRRNRKTADVVLGVWLAAFALDLLVLFLTDDGRFRANPHLLYTTSAFTFLYGPFFYFYVRFLTASKVAWAKRDLLHLLPFLLVAGSFVPFFVLPAEEKIRLYAASLGTGISLAGAIQILIRGFHGAIYVAFGFIEIKRCARRASDSVSNPAAADVGWLWTLAASQASIWLTVFLSLVFLMLDPGIGHFLERLVWPLGALSVYMIGFMALRRSSLFTPQNDPRAADKYRKTKLDPTLAVEYEASVLTALRGKRLYLDPDLSLAALSDDLGVPAYRLSQVINDRMGKTFFSLVNSLRVDEAKRLLADPSCSDRSILDIAFSCGFNSKTAFNEVFRRFVKKTPSVFRKTRPAL